MVLDTKHYVSKIFKAIQFLPGPVKKCFDLRRE